MGSYFTFDGAQLQAAIHATGLSNPAFAKLAGLNHGTLLRALRGQRVYIEKAVAIARCAEARVSPEAQSLRALQASSRSA